MCKITISNEDNLNVDKKDTCLVVPKGSTLFYTKCNHTIGLSRVPKIHEFLFCPFCGKNIILEK
jgi:hypothetical protein